MGNLVDEIVMSVPSTKQITAILQKPMYMCVVCFDGHITIYALARFSNNPSFGAKLHLYV